MTDHSGANAFVTRAAGFIGTELVKALVARGELRRHAKRRLRVWRVPATATRLVAGSALADHLHADAVFSNIRLRGTGFHFRYPTLDQGLEQVLGALHE